VIFTTFKVFENLELLRISSNLLALLALQQLKVFNVMRNSIIEYKSATILFLWFSFLQIVAEAQKPQPLWPLKLLGSSRKILSKYKMAQSIKKIKSKLIISKPTHLKQVNAHNPIVAAQETHYILYLVLSKVVPRL